MKQAGYSKPVEDIEGIDFATLENNIESLKRNTSLVREPSWHIRAQIEQERDDA